VSSPRRTIASLALILVMSFVGGCGTAPTAPLVAQQAPVTMTLDGSADSNGLIGSIVGIVGDLVRLVVRVLNLDGSRGGSISNGRWRVDIPANAVDGTAVVTMGVPSQTSPGVALEITPASKNHFATPARLSAKCDGVSDRELRTYVIHWYNPDTRTWVPVEGSTVDLTTRTVNAPLQHFSKYSVAPLGGKAGW
jgi:hypothetical protein